MDISTPDRESATQQVAPRALQDNGHGGGDQPTPNRTIRVDEPTTANEMQEEEKAPPLCLRQRQVRAGGMFMFGTNVTFGAEQRSCYTESFAGVVGLVALHDCSARRRTQKTCRRHRYTPRYMPQTCVAPRVKN